MYCLLDSICWQFKFYTLDSNYFNLISIFIIIRCSMVSSPQDVLNLAHTKSFSPFPTNSIAKYNLWEIAIFGNTWMSQLFYASLAYVLRFAECGYSNEEPTPLLEDQKLLVYFCPNWQTLYKCWYLTLIHSFHLTCPGLWKSSISLAFGGFRWWLQVVDCLDLHHLSLFIVYF